MILDFFLTSVLAISGIPYWFWGSDQVARLTSLRQGVNDRKPIPFDPITSLGPEFSVCVTGGGGGEGAGFSPAIGLFSRRLLCGTRAWLD